MKKKLILLILSEKNTAKKIIKELNKLNLMKLQINKE